MTLAVDKTTGEVIGQAVRLPLNVEVACRTEVSDPERFTTSGQICVLTRDGYTYVQASSVRLEVVR